MIAFARKTRGRPVGSRNIAAPLAPGMRVSGAATSAAKMNCRAGLAERSAIWVWIPREGFVRWSGIELQVEEAYLQWRRKKALQGVLIYDKEEAREIDVTGGRAPGHTRRDWLREWGARHAQFCRLANVENIFSTRKMINQGSGAETA